MPAPARPSAPPSTPRHGRGGIPPIIVYLAHALALSLTAFGLNYVWEFGQCSWFIHLAGPATPVGMILPALGDVLLTWAAQVVVALVSGRWLWCVGHWSPRIWITLTVSALVMSISFELWALETDRWVYTEINPLLPGTPVALTPVLQLLILFPAAFGITRVIIRRYRDPSEV